MARAMATAKLAVAKLRVRICGPDIQGGRLLCSRLLCSRLLCSRVVWSWRLLRWLPACLAGCLPACLAGCVPASGSTTGGNWRVRAIAESTLSRSWSGGGLEAASPSLRRRLGQAAYLARALLAAAHVPLELVALAYVVDRVDRVGAAQRVQVIAEELHQLTPMQSRILIRPSRILVLIVPSVLPSRAATSR